jgi:LytS/YehU family sensor histidine kinase
MCIKLSDFLRSTLKLGEQTSISLKDELALVKAYLDVEQVRFGARLKTEFHTDLACEGCIVPPLFLQPLVENAVKHGIAGMVDGGIIEVDAHCRNGWLEVKIENAYDPDAPPASRVGLGLENVRRRLRALYENQARLDTSVTDDHFVVQVQLPCAAHV